MWNSSRGNTASERRRLALGVVVSALLSPCSAHAQPPAPRPPTALTAADRSWDNGTGVALRWSLSPDEGRLLGYIVRRRAADDAEFVRVDMAPPGTTAFVVPDLTAGRSYVFQVTAVSPDNVESIPVVSGAVTPRMNAFDGTRLWFLVTLILFCGSVVLFIALARRGMPMKVRRIAGLESVDNAVGRATEMGRPCLFIPGIQDMNEIQTIAGLTILGHVARTVAEYDATIEVPTSKSLVMTTARETVQSAFLAAGRPDAYNPDSVYYVSDEQFGYVGYLQGLMVRERPAACFYLGSFFAEALLLAETGNSIGAIQIAGTAQPAQLPFFVAACDYTLIGEEFLAASAYLSGEPDQLGSLKGQDVGKLIVAAGIMAGVAAATIVSLTGSTFVESVLRFFTETMLT
jgi:hypothetical protein